MYVTTDICLFELFCNQKEWHELKFLVGMSVFRTVKDGHNYPNLMVIYVTQS